MKNVKRSLQRHFKNREVIIHVMGWSLYILLVTTSLGEFWNKINKTDKIMIFLSFPVVFNLNLLYLIPRFLKRKKWIQHIALIILSSFLLELIRVSLGLLSNSIILSHISISDILKTIFLIEGNLSLPIFLGILLSFAYRFSKDWLVNLTIIEKLKAEKLAAELSYLKSQVDPHFLFNTLNSLYALSLEEKSINTAESIAKLGTLMRYNLHDSDQEYIELSKELDYINKYIDLQSLRLTKENQVTNKSELTYKELESKKIAPMILIPFIENAFKYGVRPTEATTIEIIFEIDAHRLKMNVSNTIVNHRKVNENSGIGLSNVRKRLDLVYPGNYQLEIEEKENIFKVMLEVPI